MPRRIHHIGRIIPAVCVEVLCPGVIGVAGVAILRDKSARSRVIESRIHVLQTRRRIRYATGEGDFICSLRYGCLRGHRCMSFHRHFCKHPPTSMMREGRFIIFTESITKKS